MVETEMIRGPTYSIVELSGPMSYVSGLDATRHIFPRLESKLIRPRITVELLAKY
jgi:hypothetical protein